MVGFWNYTVYMTYIGMLSAVTGILLSARGHAFWALLCLIVCGAVDGVDGTIARTKKNRTPSEKRFGIEIDSLSDLVAFGVLPGAIACALSKGIWPCIVAAIYALCALIRLSYFDVLAQEKLIAGDSSACYVGLPVTTAAYLLPAVFCFIPLLGIATVGKLLPWLLLALGVLFITPFHMKKPGKLFVVIGVLLSAAMLITLLIEHGKGLI